MPEVNLKLFRTQTEKLIALVKKDIQETEHLYTFNVMENGKELSQQDKTLNLLWLEMLLADLQEALKHEKT